MLALFSGTRMLSKGERELPRHGPWCVNKGLPVPRPSWVGWRLVGGLCGVAGSGTTVGSGEELADCDPTQVPSCLFSNLIDDKASGGEIRRSFPGEGDRGHSTGRVQSRGVSGPLRDQGAGLAAPPGFGGDDTCSPPPWRSPRSSNENLVLGNLTVL